MVKFVIYETNKQFLTILEKKINSIMINRKLSYKIFKEPKEFYNVISSSVEPIIYIIDITSSNLEWLDLAIKIRKIDKINKIIFLSFFKDYNYIDKIILNRIECIDYINKKASWQKRLEETIEYILTIINVYTITISSKKEDYIINLSEITYIERIPNSTKCQINFLKLNPIYVNKSLQELENILTNDFIRTHKSYIVNFNNIIDFNWSEKKIIFRNSKYIYAISNNIKKRLKEELR